MNNRYYCLTFLCCILVITYSCVNNSDIHRKILSQADNLIELKPDSALILLSLISDEDASGLSLSEQNERVLLGIIAKDKCKQDISNDTLIYSIPSYFVSKKNYLRASQAYLYSGKVHWENENYKDAIQEFLKAEYYNTKINGQERLKGLVQAYIAESFSYELHEDKAIEHYRKATDYFHQAGDYANESLANNHIGICHIILDSPTDSSLFYFQKSLDIADKVGDKEQQLLIRHNLGLMWAEFGDLEKSFFYLNDALKYGETSQDTTKIYINLSRVFEAFNALDSANIYISKVELYLNDNTDYDLRKNLTQLESSLYKKKGDYKKALTLYEGFVDYLDNEYSIRKNNNILEVEKKYNLELLKNEHNEKVIFSQRLILILFLLVSIGTGLTLFYRHKLNKNKKALLKIQERKILLEEMVNKYSQQNNSLKSRLLDHFDIVKKITLLNKMPLTPSLKKGERLLNKINEILYSEVDEEWNLLYNDLIEIYGRLDLFRQYHSELDETDFKICCLLMADYSSSEIATLLGFAESTINFRRSFIRKKLGLKGYSDIAEYIRTEINNY